MYDNRDIQILKILQSNGRSTASDIAKEIGLSIPAVGERIKKLVEKGALGASVSGNGPSIAAVAKNNNLTDIKKVFSTLEGTTTISKINNKKAEVHEL